MRSTALTRRSFLRSAAVAGAVAACTVLGGCAGRGSSSSGDEPSSRSLSSDTVFVFDTAVTVTAACDGRTLSEAIDRCYRYESLFSRTVEGSDVSKINCALGRPVEVSEQTARLISLSLAYSEATKGLFDITIGAASELWDFKEGVVADPELLEEAVRHIDYRMVAVDGRVVSLGDPRARIDLGGIAKGFVADELCAFFRERGCSCACIDVGGTIATIGSKPGGAPWRIGIADPLDPQAASACVLELANECVVTSGITQRCFEKDGALYWHILDPKTGYPIQTDIASASWVSSRAIDGEGFAKALFGMTAQEGLAYSREKGALECFLVDRQGERYRLGDNA